MSLFPYVPLGAQDPHRREIALLILGFWAATILVWAAPLPFLGTPVPFLPIFALCTNAVGVVLSYGLYAGFVALTNLRTVVKVCAAVLLVFFLAGLHAWLDAELVRFFQQRFAPQDVSDKPMMVQALLGAQDFLPLYGFTAVAIFLLVSSLAARDHQRQLAQARADARDAQLAALRLQLNPHFLFNTLNAISTMILVGRNQDADRMTGLLSEFLRSSLRADTTGMIELDEEIDGLSSYLEIEAVRFGERLKTVIELADDSRTAPVPALLLQPLVENAIKHGVAPSTTPVTITVRARRDGDRLLIVVEDDGPGEAAPGAVGTGIGLTNLRSRLATAYGAQAGLTVEVLSPGYRVSIVTPFSPTVRSQA